LYLPESQSPRVKPKGPSCLEALWPGLSQSPDPRLAALTCYHSCSHAARRFYLVPDLSAASYWGVLSAQAPPHNFHIRSLWSVSSLGGHPSFFGMVASLIMTCRRKGWVMWHTQCMCICVCCPGTPFKKWCFSSLSVVPTDGFYSDLFL
jgi:hypothetical protein